MKRKLIKQASQAVTVTLPIGWIRDNNLKSGEEVDFEVRENDLIISSGKKTVGNSIKLDISEMPKNTKYNSIFSHMIDQNVVKTQVYLEHQ